MKQPFIALCTILFATLFTTQNSIAQTNISGSIYSDTTLTKANSPYIITDDLVIFQGAELTLEPGVTIKYNLNKKIVLRGTLVAEGTSTDSIKFTNNTGDNTTTYSCFKLENSNANIKQKLSMNYCIVEYSLEVFDQVSGKYGTIAISNSTFRQNKNVSSNTISHDTVYISNTSFLNNNYCFAGGSYAEVNNCEFRNNYIAANACRIDSCVFIENVRGAGANYIKNSLFYNNKTAISTTYGPGTYITNNEISYNDTGIWIQAGFNHQSPQFKENKICHNNTWNIYYSYNNNIPLDNNCWCTNDSVKIRATIRDGYIDNSNGLISFTYNDTCTIISTPPTTGINNVAGNTINTKLYPNPTYGNTILEYSYNRNEQYTVTIKTITGKTIYIQRYISNGKVTLPTNNLPAGIYIIQLQDSKQVLATEKLAVQ